MEYASETDAAAAVKKYQDVEVEGHKLYVIKAMTERMMSFGEMAITFAYLLCTNYVTVVMYTNSAGGYNLSCCKNEFKKLAQV